MKIRSAWLGLLLLGAEAAGAQMDVREERYLEVEAEWSMPGRMPVESGIRGPAFEFFAADGIDAGAEELAALLAVEPPPIARETLDGDGAGLHRYHGLPGGIVLGLSACVPAELEGARIARDERGVLGLRLDERFGGGFVKVPALEPDRLRACACFVRERLDGLVDLTAGYGMAPRLAPAFANSELGELLVRMDQVPHRLVPETRAWKTLIVDRATRVSLRAGELAFAADLEVRCYDDRAGTGWARRVLVIDAPGADFIGPRMVWDLCGELVPLAEVAGWLGFLRWAERVDPRGFEALCAE
jgi:hypothetical protein